jgi:hypothetical protein
MRLLALLLCLVLPACSLVSESIPKDVVASPDSFTALKGLKTAASEVHFAEPVEV